MRSQLWMRKPVSMFEEEQRNSKLRRVLGKWGLTAMGVGAVIGAGIFVLTGLAAREYAGPALAISFVIAGLGCALAALCYAEFASILPVEGSAYAYSYATMGEFFAWIIGWDLILEYAMASASVAVGFSGYFGKFLALFNVHFPIWLMHDHSTVTRIIRDATAKGKFEEMSLQYSSMDMPTIMGFEFAFNLPAFLIIMLITAILVKGIKEAASTNLGMVIIQVVVLLFIIVVGAFFIDTNNWVPFVPERYIDASGHGHYGWFGVFAGAAYVFFAYIGFDAVSTQAGEAKNPQKTVPFGILVSLAICTVLYILVALVLTGMVHYTDIDLEAPLSAVFASHNQGYAVFIISVAALAGLGSTLLVMLLGQSRVFYAMSKDGLLPKNVFGTLHSKYHTPYKATLLTGVVVAFISALTPIEDIAKLVNIGTLLAFILVCMAVWIMRVKEPDRPRGFRTPYLPVVATLGIIANLVMMLSLEWVNWVRLCGWLGIGVLIYFIYSKRHSVLGKRLKNNEL